MTVLCDAYITADSTLFHILSYPHMWANLLQLLPPNPWHHVFIWIRFDISFSGFLLSPPSWSNPQYCPETLKGISGYTKAAEEDWSIREEQWALVNERLTRESESCTAPIHHFGFPNVPTATTDWHTGWYMVTGYSGCLISEQSVWIFCFIDSTRALSTILVVW